MSGSSSRSPTGNSGWKVIDEALDGIRRAAFNLNSPDDFYGSLTRQLNPIGVSGWSLWRLEAGRWNRSATGRESFPPTDSAELADAGRAPADRAPADRAPAERAPAERGPAERGLVAAAWEANAARLTIGPGARTVAIAAPFGKGDLVSGVFVAWRERPDAGDRSERPDTGAATEGFARLAEALAEEIRMFALRRALFEARQAGARHSRLEPLLVQLHEHLSLAAATQHLVNEARIVLDCDRVAVSLAARRRQRLAAISGSEQPHRQSAVVERLEPLCSAVAAMGEPLWLGGQPSGGSAVEELPPELSTLWDAYREVSPCQALAIVPLRLPKSLGLAPDGSLAAAAAESQAAALDSNSSGSTVFATLVCERIERSFDSAVADLLRQLEPHAAAALANARVMSRVPLGRFWLRWDRSSGRSVWRRGAVVVAACALMVAALLLIPAELEVRASGELRSVARREVFAPADGVVEELRVDHGQLVAANALLLVVHAPELDQEWQEARSVVDSLQRQLASVQSQRLQARAGDAASRQRSAALAAEEEQLQTQRKSQAERLAMLERRRESLRVRSPIAGRIVSWGLRDRLSGRPLRQGDALLTVAGDGGPFELELQVPERVAGRVLASAAGPAGGQQVAWTLASRPEATRRGTVCELARRFDYDDWGGAFLRVRVTLEDSSGNGAAPREIGEMVAAKIACGRVSLAEAWFFELIDTARRWWWL